MNENRHIFPETFRWGVATAAYQIEGAHDAGGRTASIWDTFTRMPGKVWNGDTGDRACEHYFRYKDDVRLLSELGIKHYRFSISWPRIFPAKGRVNAEGLAFYRDLLDELARYSIEPMVTIYHWDLPQWIQDEGGWTSRKTVEYFLDYAGVLFEHFGRDVPLWNTHNEPWCAAFLGYGVGVHAPGHTNWREAVTAAHHILLSHGLAVRAYRQLKLPGQIGIVLNLNHNYAATDSEQDEAACRRYDGYLNRWFLDPLYKGAYPEDMMAWFRPHVGEYNFMMPGDMDVIREPSDFMGINYYSRSLIREGTAHELLQIDFALPEGCEVTDMGWEVHPESLYRLLTRIQKEYTTIPLYITENGGAFADQLENGEVKDEGRIRYVKAHLEQVHRHNREGGNVQGYYLWSLMDNFEWAYGYEKRFGMVYVDYETQVRTPKASALWYREVMANNGV